MKRCFKCSRDLPESEFYPHPRMADGLLGQCKDCSRRDATLWRNANIERARAYDRQRAVTPVRAVLRARVTREWRERYPGRAAAQTAAERHVKQMPEQCEDCGQPGRLERHHPDYGQPTNVQWLCKPCHYKADEARRALEAKRDLEAEEGNPNVRPNNPDEIDIEIPNTPSANRSLWREKGYDD